MKILSAAQAVDVCYKRQLTKQNLIRTRQSIMCCNNSKKLSLFHLCCSSSVVWFCPVTCFGLALSRRDSPVDPARVAIQLHLPL